MMIRPGQLVATTTWHRTPVRQLWFIAAAREDPLRVDVDVTFVSTRGDVSAVGHVSARWMDDAYAVQAGDEAAAR